MHRSIATAIAIAAAAWTGNGFADDITVDTTPFASTKTRAEVLTELKSPSPNFWSSQYNMFSIKSSTSNRELMDEYIKVRPEVSALTGEDSGSALFTQLGYKGTASTTTMGGPPAR